MLITRSILSDFLKDIDAHLKNFFTYFSSIPIASLTCGFGIASFSKADYTRTQRGIVPPNRHLWLDISNTVP
jgi:hypothetical protein